MLSLSVTSVSADATFALLTGQRRGAEACSLFLPQDLAPGKHNCPSNSDELSIDILTLQCLYVFLGLLLQDACLTMQRYAAFV